MKLSEIKPNPRNPRIIKDEKFKALCKSLKEFPRMMELRPIVVDDQWIILGGNMRYRALKENGMREIPDAWVKRADELTEEQKREFVVKDNAGFGEWDLEALANEWDDLPLADWGLDVPLNDDDGQKIEEKTLRPYNKVHILISLDPSDISEVMHAISTIKADIEVEQSAN